MAVNLVRSYSSEEARHLLNLSFAQYQTDRDVVKIEARLDRRLEQLAELRAAAESPYGDIHDFRARIDGTLGVRSESAVEFSLNRLRPGAVIYVDKAKVNGRCVVLATAHRSGGVKLNVLTSQRATLNLSARDFREPVVALGHVQLPEPYAPTNPTFQKLAIERLISMRAEETQWSTPTPGHQAVHPVEDDPDLKTRLKAAVQSDRVAREVDELREQVKARGNSVARKFDRVLKILQDWEYISGWSLTNKGEVLARTFHESDLLVAECLDRGLLDDLDPAAMAGLASVFVYEHRSSEPPPAPWFPSAEVRKKWRRIESVSRELQQTEQSASLNQHRAPDPTYIAIAHAWAAGEGFAEVVEAEELSGGDFVRTMKQLIDLLRQIATMAPSAQTRGSAEAAAKLLMRGVVAASSSVPGVAP
jgi:ATP-dependent RNA helicase HelY